MSLASTSIIVCVVVAAVGCVTVQDLGSHGLPEDGGPPGVDAFPPLPTDSGPGGKIFFVTDNRYPGDLGGLAGADTLCTKEARAAGLAGPFKAWLSTPTENAKSRIAPVGPWQMVNGDTVFDGPAVTSPSRFPKITATKVDLFFSTDTGVWTGTSADGTQNSNGATCAGWTSDLASAQGSYGGCTWISSRWTDDNDFSTSLTSPCSARLRLYCFGQ